MSLLQTPPRERMAIETVATRDTDDTIRKAILQEINREGQVYYLHNRVLSIDRIRERLERIVPEARIEVAHGQMAAAELADIMRRFIAGDFDVLLCTTIIESGVDIPRANTILIDRADRFGIADLYQLRGRVGRSSHKAYAYFLLPATGRIEPDARERIAAIKKYSSLSAGFNLALRDLEIRGAGNMLGTAQSGHIAAVGFALYCQLLKRSVARLSGKPIPHVIDVMLNLDFIDTSSLNADSPAAAMIPYAYIEQEPLRVDCYRRIAEATTDTEIEAVATDLCDRFGPPPPAVTRLLTLARLRLQAAKKGLHRLETRDGKVMIGGPQDLHMPNGRFPRLQATEPDQRIGELSDIIAGIPA
jgi:transcription-repair coupling factor (superfamily II helicase)